MRSCEALRSRVDTLVLRVIVFFSSPGFPLIIDYVSSLLFSVIGESDHHAAI